MSMTFVRMLCPSLPRKRRGSLALSVLACLIFIRMAERPASAQVFQLDGGSSSLFQGSGGSLAVRSSNYGGHFDFGLFQSAPRFGFGFSMPRNGYDWDLGDQSIPFVLPTDLFDTSYYFLGRGIGAQRKTSKSRYFYFAGATSTAFFVPFMNAVVPQTGAGVFFFEHKWNPRWKFVSRNVVSRTQTSIQSLEWLPRTNMDVGFSAGLGSNQGYGATSFKWSRDWAALRASYALAGDQFRRITVNEPVLTEQNKENVEFDATPLQNVRLTLARQNYLSPVFGTSSSALDTVERATVNSVGAWGLAKGFQLYGSLFLSRNSSFSSRAYALGTRHSVTSRVDLGVDYLSSTEQRFAPQNSFIYTVRERINPRIELSQFIVRNNGQTTISYGGSFLANVFSVSLDYQTMYFPLAIAGGQPFRQVLTLNLHLQFPNGVQLNAETDVTPAGKTEYTAYGTDYLYGSYMGGPGMVRSPGFYRNMVRGKVVDAGGEPVDGATLLIGTELAYTDSNGEFSARFKQSREMKFQVLVQEFTAPGWFEVLSAPPTVQAVGEANAVPYKIVVRRVSSPTVSKQ